MTRMPPKLNGASKVHAEAGVRRRPKPSGSSADAASGPEEHARRARLNFVSDDQLERAASIFRAAGDISRLKLLHRLSDGEWCVTELAEAAGVGLSTVSQQLRLLRAERIVSRRRTGKHIYYALADRHVSDLIRNALEHAVEERSHEDDDRD